MEEFTCHISNSGCQRLVIELDCIKTFRHCKEEEQSSFRMSPPHTFRHILFKKREKKVSLTLIEFYALLEVCIKPSAGKKLGCNILVEDRRAKIKGLLADIDLVKNFRVCNRPTETESWSEYLGE